MGTTHRIAVIPGDGIGKEVAPEGLRVLQAAASAFDFDLDYDAVRLRQRRLLRQDRGDAARRLV